MPSEDTNTQQSSVFLLGTVWICHGVSQATSKVPPIHNRILNECCEFLRTKQTALARTNTHTHTATYRQDVQLVRC
jgi:hypothetical protein